MGRASAGIKTLSDTPQIVLQSKRKPDTQHRLNLDLKGSYQNKNVKAVLSSTEILQRQGFHISEADLRAGLSEVKKQTGLLGRWQTLNTDPLIICDTGHNEDGIKEVLKNIQTVSYQKLHFVLGMVKDKDISKVLSLLPKEAYYYFTQPQLERAKPSIELAREAAAFGLEGESFHTVSEAVSAAKKNAAKDDFIFIGGSTFVVAEAL